jgi:hypothetical protein
MCTTSISAGPCAGKTIPRLARRIIKTARRRYWRAEKTWRPNLAQPVSYVGLFAIGELQALAKCLYWPLPPEAIAAIAEPPAERKRRTTRFRLKVESSLAELLAKKAKAIRMLLFAKKREAVVAR